MITLDKSIKIYQNLISEANNNILDKKFNSIECTSGNEKHPIVHDNKTILKNAADKIETLKNIKQVADILEELSNKIVIKDTQPQNGQPQSTDNSQENNRQPTDSSTNATAEQPKVNSTTKVGGKTS